MKFHSTVNVVSVKVRLGLLRSDAGNQSSAVDVDGRDAVDPSDRWASDTRPITDKGVTF